MEYIQYGEVSSEPESNGLRSPQARATLSACEASTLFEVLELRRRVGEDGSDADVIVVDVTNDEVPSRNRHGIAVCERIALIFFLDSARPPEVRALRTDFPLVPHLNYVPAGDPAWLCLYFEPWSETQRTWTAQKHLRRILWWLTQTARETLHRGDQPLEQLYFESPYELVLPPDFHEKVSDSSLRLAVHCVDALGKNARHTLRTCFVTNETQTKRESRVWVPIAFRLAHAAEHGRIDPYPQTLGELEDQLRRRGSSLFPVLAQAVRDVSAGGVVRSEREQCVLIASVPVVRGVGSQPESEQLFGFAVQGSLAQVGHALGVLHPDGRGQYHAVQILGGDKASEDGDWRGLQLAPLSLAPLVTRQFARRASGVPEDTGDFRGVLAGVGALGGSLMEVWSRESWGSWTVVDDDVLRPHNIVRHPGKQGLIGQRKAEAVRSLAAGNYHPGYYNVRAIIDSVTNEENRELVDVISVANLFVDATTTLDVPRSMSRRDQVPRSVSVFLTPSGRSCAALVEDSDRRVRLDALEAQYYRAILNSRWGTDHLIRHRGELWAGAGCRDVSTVLSYGAVQLHSGILAEQLRRMCGLPQARICLWSSTEESAVSFDEIEVELPREFDRGQWHVVLDEGVRHKLKRLRHADLPNETGGIVFGYTDHKTSTIAVVDVSAAPIDSVGDTTGFSRGVKDLQAEVERVRNLTANVVGYVGEWHSHPPFIRPEASSADARLLFELRQELERDGEPALMLIIGADGELAVHVNGLGQPGTDRVSPTTASC